MKDERNLSEHLTRRAHPGADPGAVQASRVVRGMLEVMRDDAAGRGGKHGDDRDDQHPGCRSEKGTLHDLTASKEDRPVW